MWPYLWNLLIAIDQGINTALGPLLNIALRPVAPFGNPDETLSSVFGKNVQAGACRGCQAICRILNWLDPDHCDKSIEKSGGAA